MSGILYNIIISPIELILEFIFEIIYRLIGQRVTNQGFAIIGVSIAVSLLTLPLYKRADFVQKQGRDTYKKLLPWISHIKKAFSGDERFMILQAYYRENNYSPLHALKGSLSLLLEIPFFIAAFHFLSNLTVLKGASFGIISDLSYPDGLIRIGNFSINLLPVLMTTINIISSAIYLKDFPLKDKIQTYGMALIFLVLLYKSPSGLVIYWTCNNIFSLVKNIFYKIRNPKKVIIYLISIAGTLFTILVLKSGIINSLKKLIFIVFFEILALLPLTLYLINKYIKKLTFNIRNDFFYQYKNPTFIFGISSAILILLLGILIPSNLIVKSPVEFIDTNITKNPLLFLINSTCYSIGFFLLWTFIIYRMTPKSIHRTISNSYFIISIILVSNYLFFSGKLGNISPFLKYDTDPSFSLLSKIINLLVISLIIVLFIFIFKSKFSYKISTFTGSVIIICISLLSIKNISNIKKELKNKDVSQSISYQNIQSDSDFETVFNFSKEGKNVLVIMLDRAIGSYFPLCLNEKDILKEQFSGFTYYPNTISFGSHTIFGAPPIFGGYEYTPTAINNELNKSLVEKHNEALKVMPELFLENNYDVTVCDPPFANYQWDSDLSIYSEYPEIKTFITNGKYTNKLAEKYDLKYGDLKYNKRNFFCYGLFSTSPVLIKNLIYDDGNYYNSALYNYYYKDFVDTYSVLEYLKEITNINDSKVNTFTMIDNDTTHSPCHLYLPNYTLVPQSDSNSSLEYTRFHSELQQTHYDVNMLSLLSLGKWFDYLKANDVWDNTKIIIVSDHGYTNGYNCESLGAFDNMIFDNIGLDLMMINPLLIVKDFNSKSFKTDDSFMTNADVPSLVFKDLIDTPINPFTGNVINSDEKFKHPQLITASHKNVGDQDPNSSTFNTEDGVWYSVHDNIFDEKNWTIEK